MNLLELKLKNIGPFKNCSIDLAKNKDDDGYNVDQPTGKHLIITGENGTGKSIVIDAIRTILYGELIQIKTVLERNIISNNADFKILSKFSLGRDVIFIESNNHTKDLFITTNQYKFNIHISVDISKDYTTDFVLEYWNSVLNTERFEINGLELLDPKEIFSNPLTGVHKNINVAKTIAFFDYLKGAEHKHEAEVGTFLFDTSIKIINSCINDGHFLEMSRTKLTPLFMQYGHELTIDKLSSASVYLIQRMLSLLCKAYAAYVINSKSLSDILNVSGLLLIDEAETHLHPKWQKILFKTILEFFPNIQIIATTHSPFIVSSLENAEVMVCKANKDGCFIENETEVYSNKPIEEIIRTPLFDTDSFNIRISNLLKSRKKAILEGDDKTQKEIEKKLEIANPEYFKYFKIDDL